MKSTDIIKASANSLNIYSLTAEALERLIEAVKAEQPCPTCEALARTVMLDQTSHDTQRKPLTDEQIEKLREKTFSTGNPYCPVDSKSMRKAARAIEAAHNIKE